MMRDILSRYGLILGVIISALLGIMLSLILQSGQLTISAPAVRLTNTFKSNAFIFRYPPDWDYQIPQPNIMFLASPAILQQQNGASATIQRTIAIANVGETLEEKLNEVLSRGPLRSDRFWEKQGQTERLQIGDYDAVGISVIGSEQEDTLTLKSYILLLQADNNFVYIITFTAPYDVWQDHKPIFDAILASMQILE